MKIMNRRATKVPSPPLLARKFKEDTVAEERIRVRGLLCGLQNCFALRQAEPDLWMIPGNEFFDRDEL